MGDVSPGFTGAVKDAYKAVKDYARATKAEARSSASITGNRDEDAQLNESEQASNAGRQAQSTDHMNQY